MKKALFGIANTESQAEDVLAKLHNDGFDYDSMSALYQNISKTIADGEKDYKKNIELSAVSHEMHTKAPEGAAVGATAGGIIGGTIGLLAGIGSLALPGLGPFIAAGPLMAALSGSGVGGGVGLLVGAFSGMGIPEYEAKMYENRLKMGGILVSVVCKTDNEVEQANELFEKNGIEDISIINEQSFTK